MAGGFFEVLLFGQDHPRKSRDGVQAEVESDIDPTASSTNLFKEERYKVSEQDLSTPSSSIAPVPSFDPPTRKRSNPLDRSQTISSITSLVERLTRQALQNTSEWSPSAFQLRPLTGLMALAISICCVFAALAILVTSDGQPEDSWTVRPSVYLAIVAALSNTALIYARCQATPSSWFYHASCGASVRSLQRHWQVTNSLSGAIINSRNLSLLHLVCFVTSIVMIDGPLLQKASAIVPTTTDRNVTLNLVLPPELPTGFSGYYLDHILYSNPTATGLGIHWMNDTPMHLNAPGCTGSCKTTVQAPGLTQSHCSTQSWPITPAMTRNVNATWGSWRSYVEDSDGTMVASLPAFQVILSYPSSTPQNDAELVWLDVGLISWFNLTGVYNETICTFAPAIVEYDINIQGNIVNLDGSSDNQGRFVRLANNTKTPDIEAVSTKEPTTLAGLTDFLGPFVNSNGSVALNAQGGAGSYFSPNPITYNQMAMRHANWSNPFLDLNYIDPTPSIIWKYNQMMFRAAVASIGWPNLDNLIDQDVSVNQKVIARETIQHNAYKSDLRWFAGAAVLELVTVLLIFPMFWGWWTLGRKATFSPFDIALAFDSPLFAGVNSAGGAKGVVGELGDMKLKYGVVHEHDLTMFVPNASGSDDVADGRLGISTSDNVTRPRKGTRFRL